MDDYSPLILDMLRPNTTYAPLEGDFSPQTPPETPSEWEAFSSRMAPGVFAPPPRHELPIPNLQAKFIRKQREQDERVICNLNRASHRLEDQRASLPPKEWFLPQFVPAALPPQSFSPSHVKYTDPILIQPYLHSFDSVEELLEQFPSPRLDSPAFSAVPDLSPPSPLSPHNPTSQGFSSYESSSSRSQRSIDNFIPSLVSLIETSTGRLDQQRAEPTRPRSWGSPVVAPLMEPRFYNPNRRGSLLSAIDRIRREGSQMFLKKKVRYSFLHS